MVDSNNVFAFKNVSLLDFASPETRASVESALHSVRTSVVGNTYSPIIGGVEMSSTDTFVRCNPASFKEVIGTISMAGIKDANRAVTIAESTQPEWARRDQSERSDVLRKAAGLLEGKRFFFLALMILETGKNREDADGEIAEAIDFLRYYAAVASWLPEHENSVLVDVLGEQNSLFYRPLGIGVSIQPWNFPLAISIGPAVAALVMGNAVLYKPARESSIIGYFMTKLLHEAGVPSGVLQCLPGSGSVIGNHLVSHPRVRFVAFTGSQEVGQSIEDAVHLFNKETIHALAPEQRHKKSIATLETGGKGAIYVDADADLDEAILGVTESAFVFQGQKCSACSRLFVHTDVYDEVVARLTNRIMSLSIGSPERGGFQMGPVIGAEAHERLMGCIATAAQEGEILARGEISPNIADKGFFVPPVLVGELPHDSQTAQSELFGPILSIFRVENLDEAITLVNSTQYGLTAGIFSRNEDHLLRFAQEVDAGNIYTNKKITGAVVARQPFGGMKMSGNGTKAGDWAYLLRFVHRISISRNEARRGHAIN